MRGASSDKMMQVSRLAERLFVMLSFMESVEEFSTGAEIREIVEQAKQRQDLRSLRLIAREVDAMTEALLAKDREQLETLLRQRGFDDLDVQKMEAEKRVLRILQRGRILSEKERQWLERYTESLDTSGADPEIAEAILRLLRDSP